MGLRIQNNVEAFNAHRQLTGTASKAAKAMEKLSSGYRINRAADDAAGLDIYEIADKTEFNGNKLFTGATGFTFQVGANDNESITTTAVQLVGRAAVAS